MGDRLAAVVHREIVASRRACVTAARTVPTSTCAAGRTCPRSWWRAPSSRTPSDAHLLKQPGYRRRIAQAIATGVDSWMASTPYRKRFPRVVASSSDELANEVSRSGLPERRGNRRDRTGGPRRRSARRGRLATALWERRCCGRSRAARPPAPRPSSRASHRSSSCWRAPSGSIDATCVAALCAASGRADERRQVSSAVRHPQRLRRRIASVVGVPAGGDVLLVRSGDTRAALAAAAVSAARGVPLLLTAETTLGADARGWIEANRPATKRSVTAGSAGAFSAAALTGAPGIVRISTADGALTAAKLNARYYPQTRAGTLRPVVVSAGSTVQYLVAATYAARRGQPVVPVWTTALPAHTREWITNRRKAIGGFEIMSNGSLPYLIDWELTKADAQ